MLGNKEGCSLGAATESILLQPLERALLHSYGGLLDMLQKGVKEGWHVRNGEFCLQGKAPLRQANICLSNQVCADK